MCCFSQPVLEVSDTKIFARLASDGWQCLVYQMQYESKELNAMVLPLPVDLPATDDNTVEFISLQKYDHFFDDLDSGFPLLPPPPSRSNSDLGEVASANEALVVHEVGDFVASFVPSVNDFDRLDLRFRIPKKSWDKIPGYNDYGFAVFQLKELGGQPHPMAFKFRSRLADGDDPQVFFPTVHIHDGQVHELEDFDHSLYLQAESYDQACGEYQLQRELVADKNTGYVRSNRTAKEFCNIQASQGVVDGESLIHRRDMRGTLNNTDVLAELNLTKKKKTSLVNPLSLPVVAGTIGAAGFAWLAKRRDKLSR